MKLWYNCSALDAGGALERINSVLNSEYADVLDTVYLKDEPAYGDFAELKKLYDSIRAGLGDREMTYFCEPAAHVCTRQPHRQRLPHVCAGLHRHRQARGADV